MGLSSLQLSLSSWLQCTTIKGKDTWPAKSSGDRIHNTNTHKSVGISPLSACCAAGTQRQVASLAAEKQTLQDKLDASQASSSAMQADLSSQRDRACKAEAALAEAQSRAHQLSEAAEHARQGKAEVEQRVGQEKVQAEQQVVELRAVEGQLEAEVARLQQQLEGVQGQLQVTALSGDGLSVPALLCCVYATYPAFVSAHFLLL